MPILQPLLLSIFFQAGIANACVTSPCEGMWTRIQKEPDAALYQFSVSEIFEGEAGIETLVRSEFSRAKKPNYSFANPYDRDVLIERRKAALKPFFDRFGIVDRDLPMSYKTRGTFAPAFQSDIDYDSGLIKEGVPLATARKLALLRERLRLLDSSGPEWEQGLREAEALSGDHAFGSYLYAAAECRFHWLTSSEYDTGAARDSLQRFLSLRSSSNAWVREHAFLTSISARIASLTWSLERDSKSQAKLTDVQPILDDIASFEQKYPKSDLLGAIQRYRVAAYAVMGDKQGCFENLAKLTESYFTKGSVEDIRRLHVDYSLSLCPPQEFAWRYPHLAAIAALPADLTSALSKLDTEKSVFAPFPGLFTYLKTRILFSLGKHDDILTLTAAVVGDTPLAVTTAGLRVKSLLTLKRYADAESVVTELVKARKQPGVLRLLGYRVRVIAGDFVGLANDPLLLDSDVLVWALYNNATDVQLSHVLSEYDRIPKRLRPSVFNVAVTRFLPSQKYEAFDGLKAKEGLLSDEHHKVFHAIQSLRIDASAQALLLAGDYLRRVHAGTPFMTLGCFVDTIGSHPTPEGGPWTPYRYFKEALSVLDKKDKKSVEPKILYNLVSCYRQSNSWYPCQPLDEKYQPLDPLPTRESWYHRLKSKYANTETAKRLSSYW